MSGVAENCEIVRRRIAAACSRVRRNPDEVIVVAASKMVDAAAMREAFHSGVRHFGENRVQDAEKKMAGLLDMRPAFTFHMIGRLQSNKAALAARLFDVIESVDSVRLARILNERVDRQLPVLIEVNVAGERTKSGFRPDQVASAAGEIASLERLKLGGLMTVAPVAVEAEAVRPFFRELRRLRDELGLMHLSMGMTNDFEVAIEEGATIVRIGRAIFGGEK